MSYDLAPEEPQPPGVAQEGPRLPGEPLRRSLSTEIDQDLQCVGCGYNLRGLRQGGRCPECGRPAAMSMGADRLHHAPAAWLRAVRNGLAVLLGAVALEIAGWIQVPSPLGCSLALLSAALACGGVLLLTRPEPRQGIIEPAWSLRTALRLLAMVRLIGAVGLLLASSAGLAKPLGAMWALQGIVSLVILVSLALYLRGFAERIPDDDLARSTGQVLWGLTCSLGLFVLSSAFSMVFANMPRVLGPAPCVVLAAGVATCLFAGRFMMVLYRYYQVIRWAAHDADAQLRPGPLSRLERHD